MASLPAELVDEILLRLAVKPLLRFRCVSKQWLDLIDSLEFIRLHLNRSIETKSNRSLLFYQNEHTYLVDVDSPHDVPTEIDDPLMNSHIGTPSVKGSCNGLVLLIYPRNYRLYTSIIHYDDTILVWNLSTRDYFTLPFAEFDYKDNHIEYVVYGMGYDSVHDDYKVVRIIQFNNYAIRYRGSEVKVYSLKSNTWRRIQDFPYYPYSGTYLRPGVFSCGALHWLVSEKYEGCDLNIVAFDLATEEYHLVPMPEKFRECGVNIAVLDGLLCICKLVTRRIDVWLMKNYGVKESWTKLTSAGISEDISKYEYIKTLALSKDGRHLLLMRNYGSPTWFDIERHTKRTIIDVHVFFADIVMQSLVPLGTGRGANLEGCIPEEENTGRIEKLDWEA